MASYHNLQPREAACAPPPSPSGPLHRILVVEEDPDLCRLNQEVLTGSGFIVDVVTDGFEAWNRLQQNSYDLLIANNDLPNPSTVVFLKLLQAARMALPVVVLTQQLPVPELLRHPSLPVAAMLLKPYDISVLVETVQAVLPASPDPRSLIAARANTITPELQKCLQPHDSYYHGGLNEQAGNQGGESRRR